MNLLFVTHHRRFKAEWRTGGLARELSRRGHSVTVLCTSDRGRWRFDEERSNGLRIIQAPDLLVGKLRSGWDPVGVIRRMHWLDGASFDLVHAFETRPATIHPIRRLLAGRNIPLVIDWCDWWGRGGLIQEHRPWWYRLLFGGIETWYEEHFRDAASATTVISRGLAQRAAALGVPLRSVFWIPNGCSAVSDGSDLDDRTRDRRAFGIPEDAFVVGFSALDVLIGVESVIEAVRLAHARHPNVRLLMSGRDDRRLRRTIARSGASAIVQHLGHLPPAEYRRGLRCADVFVIPFADRVANRGRWPGRVNDYLAVGRPIVTNAVGEMEALVSSHAVGVLAQESPASMADAIVALLEDPGLRSAMASRARELAQGELSWPAVVDRLEEAYAFARGAGPASALRDPGAGGK